MESLHELKLRFECLLRIHVRRDNVADLELLVREITQAFGNDSRFRLDVQHLRDMGDEGGKSVISPLSIPELREIERHLRGLSSAKSRDLSLHTARRQFGCQNEFCRWTKDE